MNPEHWQQVKEVFEAALEHDPEQRAAFLDHACAKDETIRREVQARLASHDAAPNFMDTTALAGSAGGLSGAAAKLSAGQRFGRFEVVSLLGAGGMGEVYLAHDSRLNCKIALKLLPSYFTDDQERVRRFEREARAASALNHHNILTIHEIGRADGRHFIATEFVEGETLRGRMERAKQLQFVEALDVAAQIASALQAAHAAGVIHRDIKPENIMLRRDGFVKVLDFGLAKLIEKRASTPNPEAETKMLLQTMPGMVMGTPSYMSPEQARGLEVDARTDIFSLGVVLYEMLAGRAPFAGESVADVEYLSDGMTETLISSLSQIPKLNVKARSSVFRYKGKDADARTIGKELNVQAILTGRVVQRGQDLTLYIELVDAQTENVLWKSDYNRSISNLVSLQSEITRDVSSKLKIKLSGVDDQKLAKTYTENAEAYQLYLKGRYYWYKFPAKVYEKSRDYFQQAIDVDPNYALAYSGLGVYYGFAAGNGFLPPTNENWLNRKWR